MVSKKNKIAFFFASVAMLALALCNSVPSFADSQFAVSPMVQKIILVPGETYDGSFSIVNPASSTTNFNYKIGVTPYFVDESYNSLYEESGEYSKIINWVTLDHETGTLAPNDVKEISFRIKVPLDSPAGGQYFAIIVSSNDEANDKQDNVNIQSKMAIAHKVYAEIAGTTKKSGEILDSSVPSFLFSGNVSGISTIKNTGNVHSTATYKLQVFPLFSDEELYTNEEKPEEKTVFPNRTLTSGIYWTETPKAGIFKVIYTAEFEGVVSRTEKYVIVCPFWLLFIIIFAIILIGFWLFSRNKSRKK